MLELKSREWREADRGRRAREKGNRMQFMCTHSFEPGSITREQLDQFAQMAQRDKDVKGVQSFVNLSEGKAVCIMESQSKGKLTSFFDKMGMPYDSITAVEIAGERGMMQQLGEGEFGEAEWPSV
jgi:hypothetical protein